MGKKVTVLALFKAKSGLEEEVKRELMTLQGPTRSEEGCINYDLHQSKEDPSRFMFYENWVSQEDLDKHLQMPYLKAFREKAGDLLAEPASITLHEMIGDLLENQAGGPPRPSSVLTSNTWPPVAGRHRSQTRRPEFRIPCWRCGEGNSHHR